VRRADACAGLSGSKANSSRTTCGDIMHYRFQEFLMRNKEAVVTKAEILRNVWDAHYQGPDNVVEVYVGYLRRKIDVPFGTNTIETVRGVGYRLVC
jgi:two-component system OmpR family response regulator